MTTTLVRLAAIVFTVALSANPMAAHDGAVWRVGLIAHAQQPERQEEFLPVDELPPEDQLAAAPLLVSAYAFVLLMLFGYLVSVSRRLSAVQHDIERLDSELRRSGKG